MKRVRTRPSGLRHIWTAVLIAAVWAHDAHADRKTVCTITVNSADEKEVFRRSLSPDKFQFVELVERGRPDWLTSACQRHIRCDVLVISGHYDGRDEFYSDREGAVDFLPVEEMERASCSHSCSELFSQLKEVYLFGCNTLNPEALKRASAEIGRNLVHAGYSRADAEVLSRTLSARHGESSRDRMRLIFRDVPVIYGFSAKAPLGPVAASMLSSYFRSGGASETGSGHASPRLLGHFANTSLTVAGGLNDSDALAGFRRDVCEFSDGELSTVQKLAFVHSLLGRDMAEVRLFLDRIEKYIASISADERRVPDVAQALAGIAGDVDARNRYIEFARDADQPAIRARMIKLASQLGWLSAEDEHAELVRLINDGLAKRTVGPDDVDLICALSEDGGLDQEIGRLQPSPGLANTAAHEAVLACLGSTEARAQVLHALTSPDEQEARIAQVYLRRRPITNVDEVREVTANVAQMNDPSAQVRALDTLAGQHVVDPESLETLAHLFLVATSLDVQDAVAGILIRSDYQATGTPNLAQEIRESSLTAPGRSGPIDILLRHLPGG